MANRRGRPGSEVDPAKATALQAQVLIAAKDAGIPVSASAADKVAGRLAAFTQGRDLTALTAVADSAAALEALARLAEEDPDAFLRHYAGFLEFSKPKLARVEHQHEGNPLAGIFIAVEARERAPAERDVTPK